MVDHPYEKYATNHKVVLTVCAILPHYHTTNFHMHVTTTFGLRQCHITRKMVPITGRASSLLEIIVYV